MIQENLFLINKNYKFVVDTLRLKIVTSHQFLWNTATIPFFTYLFCDFAISLIIGKWIRLREVLVNCKCLLNIGVKTL